MCVSALAAIGSVLGGHLLAKKERKRAEREAYKAKMAQSQPAEVVEFDEDELTKKKKRSKFGRKQDLGVLALARGGSLGPGPSTAMGM